MSVAVWIGNPFASLVGIPIGITSSVKGLKICTISKQLKNISQ